jgi:hypothetical protein
MIIVIPQDEVKMTLWARTDQICKPGNGFIDGLPVIFRASPTEIEDIAAEDEIVGSLGGKDHVVQICPCLRTTGE